MAIIRMAALAGAAVIALAAIVPATSYAQGPGAPLELVPGPNQAKTKTRAAVNNKKAAKVAAKAPAKATTNKSTTKTATTNKATTNKATTKTAARKSPRQDTAERPAPTTVRANARTKTNVVASRRQEQVASNAQRGRSASKQRVIRTAVVPYLTVSRPVLRRGAQEPPVIARGPNVETPEDRVMRGRDSVSLVAMLPWWRNDRMQDVSYGSAAAESKVLEAAAVWLAANGGEAEDERPGETFGHAAVDEAVDVADANEVNDIDLAAGPVPAPASPGFMQSLLALIGGAAAAAVASARALFV
jgi:hypothetical protein